MRSNRRTYLYLAGITLVACLCVLAVSFAGQTQDQNADGEKAGGNSKCYVCHPVLKTEDITTIHLNMGITCDQCHGPSIEHMHDEMLMTKPDLLFGRSEVQKMCSNPMCHKPGDDRSIYGQKDHKNQPAVKAFHDKWLNKVRPNGRFITLKAVCTDCHGTHNIVRDLKAESEEQKWINAFNGHDLKGWQATGTASWNIQRRSIVGEPGLNGKGGTLWTDELYEDYLFSMTFRADWPIHAGIWMRGTKSERGPRIEIFDNIEAAAFTGSVWVQGKGLALLNMREGLVDHEAWNTISVKVQGKRVQVWLNGEEIGAIQAKGPSKGKIGLHIESNPEYKSAKLYVREVLIQKLDQSSDKSLTSSQD